MTALLLGWCVGSLALLVALCLAPTRAQRSTLVAVCMLLCGAVALASGALAVALRTYATLSAEAPVAVITCEPLPGTPPHFRLHYTPQAPPGPAQTFELAGDQWMVSGDVLKWHPWLTVVGFRPVHKPTRVSGRFSQAAQERAQPPTLHDLNGGTDAFWAWLHRHGRALPFVEAVYGNGVFTFADPGRTYTVYVTITGYLVK